MQRAVAVPYAPGEFPRVAAVESEGGTDVDRSEGFRFLTAFAVVVLACAAAATIAAPAARAAEIAIVRPADKATIHSNVGDVTVRLRRTGRGSVRLFVDGKALPHAYRGDTVHLHGIYRGTHTLRAELVGPGGETVATSATVTFYLWHASRLFHPSQ